MAQQKLWASCPKCQGLHYAGFDNFTGVCPAGGGHTQDGSFAYLAEFDVADGPGVQNGWRSCPRCQGLHYAGFPDFKGVCPAGGGHTQDGSFAYVARFDVRDAPGVQNGWRSCPRCQGLHYAGFADFKGVCPAGGGHTQDGSFAYVAFVQGPEISWRDTGQSLLVSGVGFSRGQKVVVRIQGKESVPDFGDTAFEKETEAVADAGGRIDDVEVPLRPRFFDIWLIADDLASSTRSGAQGPIRPAA